MAESVSVLKYIPSPPEDVPCLPLFLCVDTFLQVWHVNPHTSLVRLVKIAILTTNSKIAWSMTFGDSFQIFSETINKHKTWFYGKLWEITTTDSVLKIALKVRKQYTNSVLTNPVTVNVMSLHIQILIAMQQHIIWFKFHVFQDGYIHWCNQ